MKKTAYEIKVILIALVGAVVVSCSSYANSGTASDRTGKNGATNGSGKAPTDNTHNFKY